MARRIASASPGDRKRRAGAKPIASATPRSGGATVKLFNVGTGKKYNRSITAAARLAVRERAGFRCENCGLHEKDARQMEITMTIDHLIRKRHGGTNQRDNLQYLCQPCNEARG